MARGKGKAKARPPPTMEEMQEAAKQKEWTISMLNNQIEELQARCDQLQADNAEQRREAERVQRAHEEVIDNMKNKVRRNQEYVRALIAQQEALAASTSQREMDLTVKVAQQSAVAENFAMQLRSVQDEWEAKKSQIREAHEVVMANTDLKATVSDLQAKLSRVEAQLEIREAHQEILAKLDHREDGDGLLPMLVETMYQFPDRVRLQREAATALQHLASSTARAARLVEIGGALAVVRAMQAHVDDAPLQTAAVRLLWRMSGAVDEAGRAEMLKADCVVALQGALLRSSDSSKRLRYNACGALKALLGEGAFPEPGAAAAAAAEPAAEPAPAESPAQDEQPASRAQLLTAESPVRPARRWTTHNLRQPPRRRTPVTLEPLPQQEPQHEDPPSTAPSAQSPHAVSGLVAFAEGPEGVVEMAQVLLGLVALSPDPSTGALGRLLQSLLAQCRAAPEAVGPLLRPARYRDVLLAAWRFATAADTADGALAKTCALLARASLGAAAAAPPPEHVAALQEAGAVDCALGTIEAANAAMDEECYRAAEAMLAALGHRGRIAPLKKPKAKLALEGEGSFPVVDKLSGDDLYTYYVARMRTGVHSSDEDEDED